MDIIKLAIIFLVILVIIKLEKPLHAAMIGGILATILLYGLYIDDSFRIVFIGVTSKATIDLILAFYSITFLQRMLEKRGHLLLAEESLTNIFNSRRVNAMIAPFIIGLLLPSIGAVLISAPIVHKAGGDYVTIE